MEGYKKGLGIEGMKTSSLYISENLEIAIQDF